MDHLEKEFRDFEKYISRCFEEYVEKSPSINAGIVVSALMAESVKILVTYSKNKETKIVETFNDAAVSLQESLKAYCTQAEEHLAEIEQANTTIEKRAKA